KTIHELLHAVRRRLILRSLLIHGMVVAGSILFIAALLIGAKLFLGWQMSLAALFTAAALSAAAITFAILIRKDWSLLQVARYVDDTVPSLRARLSTTVDMIDSGYERQRETAVRNALLDDA